jgi:hypothetical protein
MNAEFAWQITLIAGEFGVGNQLQLYLLEVFLIHDVTLSAHCHDPFPACLTAVPSLEANIQAAPGGTRKCRVRPAHRSPDRQLTT